MATEDRQNAPRFTPEEEAYAERLVGNPQLFELIATKIAFQVDQIAQERARRRINVAVAFFGAIFAVSIGGLAAYFGYIADAKIDEKMPAVIAQVIDNTKAEIQVALKDSIERSIDDRFADFEDEAMYLEFTSAVNILELKEEASIADIIAVVEQLRLIAENPNLTDKPSFPTLLADVVVNFDLFEDEGVDAYLDEIDDLFRSTIANDSGAVTAMLHHYAEELMNAPDAPAGWKPGAKARFDDYVRAAILHNEAANAQISRILVTFVESGSTRNATTEAFVADLKAMDQSDIDWAWGVIELYRDGSFGARAQERTELFLKAYEKELL